MTPSKLNSFIYNAIYKHLKNDRVVALLFLLLFFALLNNSQTKNRFWTNSILGQSTQLAQMYGETDIFQPFLMPFHYIIAQIWPHANYVSFQNRSWPIDIDCKKTSVLLSIRTQSALTFSINEKYYEGKKVKNCMFLSVLYLRNTLKI